MFYTPGNHRNNAYTLFIISLYQDTSECIIVALTYRIQGCYCLIQIYDSLAVL